MSQLSQSGYPATLERSAGVHPPQPPLPPSLNAVSAPPAVSSPPSHAYVAPMPPAPMSPAQVRSLVRRRGLKLIGVGMLLILVGIVISAVTYQMASGGGFYLVMYGPIAVGVLNVIRGVRLLVKAVRMV